MDPAVAAYLETIRKPLRRRDAETMIPLMRRATGQEPHMWRSIVGFGRYHYEYQRGRQGDAPAAGFAARSAATTVYVSDGVSAHADVLERLGPHTTGVACIYLKDLTAVDQELLEAIVARSYRALTEGTYRMRAREGGKSTPASP